MNNAPRFQEKFPVVGAFASFTTGWKSFIQNVANALSAWNGSTRGSATLNFGNIPMSSELALTAAVDGAAVGDFVIVRATQNMVGLFFTAAVTAPGVVTVYAKNFSTDFIDPPSIDFRFIILQN